MNLADTKNQVDFMTESPHLSYAQPLEQCLRQLARFIESISPAQYAQSPPGAPSGSIGAHVRHILDHIEALGKGLGSSLVAYDRRERGTAVESDPNAALTQIKTLIATITAIPDGDLSKSIGVELVLSSDKPSQQMQSTIGRELAFVLSHTVHHHAMIRFLAETLGIEVEDWFGYAPSTIQYHNPSCAPSQS